MDKKQKRILVAVFVAVFVFSTLNTLLLFTENQKLQNELDRAKAEFDNQLRAVNDSLSSDIFVLNATAHLPLESYDYIVYKWGDYIQAKDGVFGRIVYNSTEFSFVLNQVVGQGSKIYVKSGEYNLTSDVLVHNKISTRVDFDESIVFGNGHSIIIKGDNYTFSQNNQISGLTLIEGKIRVENSFRTTISGIVFEDCQTAIELVNSDSWSECTKIQDCWFKRPREGIAFRAPVGFGTKSYTSSEIIRCQFNLVDNSVGVKVDAGADFTDSLMQNVRFWMGERGELNQTGLKVDGSMFNTVLTTVVFESFASNNKTMVYGLDLGSNALSPNLAGDVNFLGNLTARVNNPYHKLIYGYGSFFSNSTTVQVEYGDYGSAAYVNLYPARFANLNVGLQFQGRFSPNETVTVSIFFELIDGTTLDGVAKTFTDASTSWLSYDDLEALFPSQNIVYAVGVKAKSSVPSSNVQLTLLTIGTTT